MGQCILRDLGFDFEKDSEKQKALNDFIKERLTVKYPSSYNFEKVKGVNGAQSTQIKMKGSTIPLKESPQRRSQTPRKTKLKESMVQTEEPNQNNMRKSRLRSGRISNVSRSQYSTHIKEHQLYISNAVQPSTETGDNNENSNSPTKNYEYNDHSKFIVPLNRSIKANDTGYNESPLRDSRMRSGENVGRISQLRKSSNNASGNMFDGIERIDFNDPSNPKNFTTGRSKNVVLKGFQNTYFQNFKDATSSPNPDEEKVFDDEEDEEFPFDDFQYSMQK